MQKLSKIKERIKEFIDFKGITQYQFYQETGIGKGTLNKHSGLGEDGLMKVLNRYKDINIVWLITGEKPMLKEENIQFSTINNCIYCAKNEQLISSLQYTIEVQKDLINTLKLHNKK